MEMIKSSILITMISIRDGLQKNDWKDVRFGVRSKSDEFWKECRKVIMRRGELLSLYCCEIHSLSAIVVVALHSKSCVPRLSSAL